MTQEATPLYDEVQQLNPEYDIAEIVSRPKWDYDEANKRAWRAVKEKSAAKKQPSRRRGQTTN